MPFAAPINKNEIDLKLSHTSQPTMADASNKLNGIGVFGNLTKLFSSSHTRTKKLMNWKQGTDNDTWATTAIELCVKTIMKDKGKDGAYKELKYVELILSNPNIPSRCITFPVTADGRIQVSKLN